MTEQQTQAMRQALEVMRNQGDVSVDEWIATEAALRRALEQQPADEPVACIQDLDEVKRKHLVYEKGMDWKDPLYTRPQPAAPQRSEDEKQWIGLTDDEIALICGECAASAHRHDDISFSRAIEAKLKEKNA